MVSLSMGGNERWHAACAEGAPVSVTGGMREEKCGAETCRDDG
jgi:hypothetical protein